MIFNCTVGLVLGSDFSLTLRDIDLFGIHDT